MLMICKLILHSMIIIIMFILFNVLIRSPLTYLLGPNGYVENRTVIELIPYALTCVFLVILSKYFYNKDKYLFYLYGISVLFVVTFYFFIEQVGNIFNYRVFVRFSLSCPCNPKKFIISVILFNCSFSGCFDYFFYLFTTRPVCLSEYFRGAVWWWG